jgi:hypothetical protein
MGVEQSAAAWFWRYLLGRKQSCMVDGDLSAPIDIPPCGVVDLGIQSYGSSSPVTSQIDRQKADRDCHYNAGGVVQGEE